jgi:hypothetical protein
VPHITCASPDRIRKSAGLAIDDAEPWD